MDKHFLPEPCRDILIRRDWFPPDADHDHPWSFVRVNVPRVAIWHSDAFEFGPNMNKPAADLALNILQAFLPGDDVALPLGTRCSKEAALLHQPFKEDFLVTQTADRIRIESTTIKDWIARELPRRRKALTASMISAITSPADVAAADLNERIDAHPASPALLFLVNEARIPSRRTDFEVLDTFLSKFPNIRFSNLDEAKKLEQVLEALEGLATLTRELAETMTANTAAARELVEQVVHLLDQIEAQIGIPPGKKDGAG